MGSGGGGDGGGIDGDGGATVVVLWWWWWWWYVSVDVCKRVNVRVRPRERERERERDATFLATRSTPLSGDALSPVLFRRACRFVVNPIDEIHTELSGEPARALRYTVRASGTCEAFLTLEGNRLTRSSTYLCTRVRRHDR